MSTRASIIVKDSDSEHTSYHHCDGYIEGVGEELKEFIDTHYKPDTRTADEFCKQLEDWDVSYEYDDCGVHGDVEYIYTINILPKFIQIFAEECQYNRTPDGGWDETWLLVKKYTQIFNI